MGSSEGQTYCLRWNNHKSNLVEILDALIKIESYVDCTIVVDDQVQFKAHRVVLAANSPYFQSILQDVPMDHCSILFPGVQAFEMRALLEYMYTGEVNVTQSQIPKIMKIAEQLEVKGLFDITDLKEKFNKFDDSSTYYPPSAIPTAPTYIPSTREQDQQQSSPIITTSTSITAAQSSSSSPPYSYKSTYSNLYSKSPGPSTSERHSQWPAISPHLSTTMPNAAAAVMLSSVYESAGDMNPLKRKKLSSLSSMLQYSTAKDTPILRNVLAQSHAADSSQPMPLICQPVKAERSEKQGGNNCNGSEFNSDKKTKYEEPQSPCTDKSFEDDGLDCPPAYLGDSRLPQYNQQQQQKPEWKRYKQYTRSDILSAIECVRNGMSALQASRKYGVPSRTLYDKVKKLGITTGRPMNRTMKRSPSSGGNSSGFQFSISGSNHPYGSAADTIMSQMHDPMKQEKDRDHHIPPSIPHPAAALLDPNFLQQAFEAREGDIAGREALHAIALAAAAHAAVNGMSTSPGTNGTARSPSPGFLKYRKSQSPHLHQEHERQHGQERGLEQHIEEEEYEEDKVEDLSMTRKEVTSSPPSFHHSFHQQQEQLQQPHQQTGGVIVPPITKLPSKSNEDYAINVEPKRECLTEDSRD